MIFETEEGVERARSYNETIDENPEEYGDLKYWLGAHTIDV